MVNGRRGEPGVTVQLPVLVELNRDPVLALLPETMDYLVVDHQQKHRPVTHKLVLLMVLLLNGHNGDRVLLPVVLLAYKNEQEAAYHPQITELLVLRLTPGKLKIVIE